ncbi:hypothetical protein GGR02_002206 [Anoxybacillus voinovskiensis]|uniref:Uncharacterized protein n=1 Tax=Anoxybacteroides voinovskiense TaxID=230470 RepID=A0A840DY39_9BACL|nr:hypothetical protein [Anoxybacillus voinovskiensis]MBB4074439.1 hypothetical protein [Anoxybacillus voinovskiensis]GGJ79435.1 hypothetical protein GCM10008982_31020 [Anoxybacillus voinovskiensis]
MRLYKFTELSDDAKRVAAEGYVEDARAFGFDPTVTLEEAYEILANPWERHRYDVEGVLQGKVRCYGKGEVHFEKTGMY